MVSVICLVHFDVLVVGHTNEGSFDLCVHLIIWEELEHQKVVFDAKVCPIIKTLEFRSLICSCFAVA